AATCPLTIRDLSSGDVRATRRGEPRMEIGEARTARRVNVDPRAGLEIEFVLGERQIQCRVLDLSEQALRAEYPSDAPDLPAGLWLANVAVRNGDCAPIHLRVLTLEESTVDAEGRKAIRLSASDEQARAGLWTLMDRLRAGQLGPGP